MHRKLSILFLVFLLTTGFSSSLFAGKVPAPEKGGEGFTAVNLEEAKTLVESGATVVACHSHTTDFMKGHPAGTIHITCMVPKDHKRPDVALEDVKFDVAQLPGDKNTPIVMYCASGT
ncbi:MAG: rhodanese-like domain-containing protein [Thermodesulfobacteriota bacterium]